MIDVFAEITNDGWDALVQYFMGIASTGKNYYFKLGEGGLSQSEIFTNTVDTGDGTAVYSGTLELLPVVLGSLIIVADPGGGSEQTVRDDGDGTFSGDGSGTIDYHTGEWSVTFDTAVTLSDDIDASYRYLGVLSDEKEDELGAGDDTAGAYFFILQYKAPDAPIADGHVVITDGTQVLTDTPNDPYDGEGTLSGDGSGEINYENGEVSFLFDSAVATTDTMTATYRYRGAPDHVKLEMQEKTDLDSVSDPSLYTFTKSFVSGDIVEVSGNTARIRVTLHLDPHEGIDDGDGNAPFFGEGGIFLEDDTMLVYLRFTKARKLGSSEIDLLIDEVI